MVTPLVIDHPMYQLLQEGNAEEFNQRRQAGEVCDLRGADLRGLDLRLLDADEMDLSDCVMHQADLRGVDFSNTTMKGASINGAKIAGTLFPVDLSAEEITLSLLHGTRMRY